MSARALSQDFKARAAIGSPDSDLDIETPAKKYAVNTSLIYSRKNKLSKPACIVFESDLTKIIINMM